MGDVLKFPNPDQGFEFFSTITFDAKSGAWTLHLDSCHDCENFGRFIDAIQNAIMYGGALKIRCEAPCECDEHNP